MQCFFSPCNGKRNDFKKCGLTGIKTIIEHSRNRGDDNHKKLQDRIDKEGDNVKLDCHKTCYCTYTSISRNSKGTRRKLDSFPKITVPRCSRSNVPDFSFQRDCLFCGNICEPRDIKNPKRWKPFRKCETESRVGLPSFKQVILDLCDQRQDDWSRIVSIRVNGVLDLPAADAQYHINCYDNFRRPPIDSTASKFSKPSVDNALAHVIKQMRISVATTWTVSELHDIYAQHEGSLSKRQMLTNLSDFFGDEIVTLHIEGCSDIVGFRETLGKTIKFVKLSETSETDTYFEQIVRQIRSEVRSIPLSRDYDLTDFRYEKLVRDTSHTLQTLVSSLVSNGEISKQSLTLSQCIQQHVNESRNQTSLALAVKLYHQFGSSELIRLLHEHGIVSSYDEIVRFRKSAAKYVTENSASYNKVLGLERRIGPVFSWCDNYDLIVSTPNGRRSTHAMVTEFTQHPAGDLHTSSVTPAGIMRLTIPRLRKSEAAQLLLANKSLPIEHYAGPKCVVPRVLPENNQIQSENKELKAKLAEAQRKDALYYSQLHSVNSLEWSGFNAMNNRVNAGPSKPKTLYVYGPLIDSPPSHPDTVLTTMAYLKRTLGSLGMKYIHISMDMQLYMTACMIKWSDPDRWGNIILRPGIMHLLMSFLGTIGYLMKGTGLEELVASAYCGLPNIFNGKAWPKAMRAFRMVVAVLLDDFLHTGEKSHQEITEYLEKARQHPTGRLWVDCLIKPTFLAHYLLRAEREGDWLLQQHILLLMLPYFFSAGHQHYARHITWHLAEMNAIAPEAKHDFNNGAHVCHHSDGAPGVSSDQFGEQTYIKQGKQAGGLKGLSTNAEQVAVWTESFVVCSQVSTTVDHMYTDEEIDSTNHCYRHKEESKERRRLDKTDRQRILSELKKHSHPLQFPSVSLYNIVNGRMASDKTGINVHKAVDIGEKLLQTFSASLPSGFHKPIKREVKTMQELKKGLKINDTTVYDSQAIFVRFMIIGQKRRLNLSHIFRHELCPVPPSLFDEYGCLRKGNKSSLVKRIGVVSHSPSPPDVVLVDASQLLYHIVWPSAGTIADIAEGMKRRISTYNTSTFILFDWYDVISAKDHERRRRAGEGSTPYQLSLVSPIPRREEIMNNNTNKQQLSQLLCTFDLGSKITLVNKTDSICNHHEADISLASYMIHAAAEGSGTIRVLSDDTDVFVLLVYWCWRNGLTCKIQMEKWDGVILDINSTVDQLGQKCKGILAMHALSGCDTVSYPCGKGKVSALKVHLENNIPGLADVLGEENVSNNDLEKVGTQFFLALYGQKKCSSMTEARKEIYCKRKNPPALKQLPPTSSNLTLHVKRAHLQIMLWKSACNANPPSVDIQDYGWEVDGDNHFVMPVTSKYPIAPEELMNIVSCSCRAEGKACSGRCGCSSNGLSCTKCCVCEGGEKCFNPLTIKDDQSEDANGDNIDEEDIEHRIAEDGDEDFLENFNL